MLDPRSYIFRHALKDGTQVTLRGARADDGPKIRQAFSKLMGETIYTRFFTSKAEISDTDLKRVTGADFDRTVALLATIGSGDEEIVIGGASYVVLDADLPDRSAEMAFTVEEDYQRLGVASLLMRHIVSDRARCWPDQPAGGCARAQRSDAGRLQAQRLADGHPGRGRGGACEIVAGPGSRGGPPPAASGECRLSPLPTEARARARGYSA